MKKLLIYIYVIAIYIGFSTSLFAQPSNDNCAGAIPITVGTGSCSSILYTNVAATSVGDPAIPVCWSPNTLSNTVWFSFVATTADVEISTNFGGTLANTQLAVYSGTCGSLTQIACQEDINAGGGLYHTDVILHGLTIGNTYYMMVDGNNNTTGTFGICAQEALPLGPTLPVQDCATAQTLCNLTSVSVPNGTGGVGGRRRRRGDRGDAGLGALVAARDHDHGGADLLRLGSGVTNFFGGNIGDFSFYYHTNCHH